jgi:ABC-type polysaccharide/polyol phosphate export permease
VEQHHKLVASFITTEPWRELYCVLNPMAAIIANFRGSFLLGFGPQWNLLIPGAVGSVLYMIGGYSMFKRLEVNFADLT